MIKDRRGSTITLPVIGSAPTGDGNNRKAGNEMSVDTCFCGVRGRQKTNTTSAMRCKASLRI
jgi:hypothetical protein